MTDHDMNYWLDAYIAKFGDAVNMGHWNNEADCIKDLRHAIETGEELDTDPPPGCLY
jgi:hypothetical protein